MNYSVYFYLSRETKVFEMDRFLPQFPKIKERIHPPVTNSVIYYNTTHFINRLAYIVQLILW